jgi:hypothetical protein
MAKYLETTIKLSDKGSLSSEIPDEPCNGLMVLIDKGSNGKMTISATPVHIAADNCPHWNMFQAKQIRLVCGDKVRTVSDKVLEEAKTTLYPQLVTALEEKGAKIDPNYPINWVIKRD